MIKNGTKALLVAAIACLSLFAGIFALRTCGYNIPGLTDGFFITNKQINQPVTVDLNAATVKDLDAIPGIGTALAKNIVSYREKYGKYVDIDELMDIRGMTDELYDQINQYISLGGS